MRVSHVLVLAAVLLGACTEAEPDSPPAVAEDAEDGAGDTSDAAGDDTADVDADDDGEAAADAPDPGGSAATVAVDGTAYEATEVLECKVGEDGFPDDRAFIGTSADGEVRIDINWFADEALAGLNAVTVEVAGAGRTDGELVWSTDYVGGDAMTISQRDDGAEGTAELGSLNRPDGETQVGATWSFTC